ncbi:hypothetical protein ACFYO2_39090 [Streptomyces sp. NPDC006602]|uniref:hypothetical protein n=1 Tax=Streptomyces sp. NPDC006602 TaxID=3364751 RepID=UPI00367697FF
MRATAAFAARRTASARLPPRGAVMHCFTEWRDDGTDQTIDDLRAGAAARSQRFAV